MTQLPTSLCIRLFKKLGVNFPFRLNEKYRVFGAHLEQTNVFTSERYEPGQIIAQRHGAILVKCGQGALWLSHLKKNKLKLPAMSWLNHRWSSIPSLPEPNMELLNETHPLTFQACLSLCFYKMMFFFQSVSISGPTIDNTRSMPCNGGVQALYRCMTVTVYDNS